ncbi:MAG: hypothetical protein IJD95_03635 [Clostridia bacterium]|nr:hypothetical protein [Clostridia bacterium]
MKKILSVILASILTFTVMGGLIMTLSSCASGTTYYISSSEGNDENKGTSAKSPWKSFANINAMRLKPGDKVLLKRGDVWNERMYIRGTGAKNAWVKISNYGDKNDELPVISLNNDKHDIAIVVTDYNKDKKGKEQETINYIHIDGLDVRNTYLGIYFRFIVTKGNTGFKVTNCNFKNIYSEEAFANELDNVDNYLEWSKAPKGNLETVTSYGVHKETGGGVGEYIWPDAIRVGGIARYEDVIAREFDINNCVFEDSSGGFHVSLNTPAGHDVYSVEKVRMYDCVMTGTYAGLYRFELVEGGWDGTDDSEWGYVRNVRHIGGSDYKAGVTGPTASYMAVCNNILVEKSEMSYVYNHGGADGCGFDYETYVSNITQRNMVYHNNDAAALLILNSDAYKKDYQNVSLLDTLSYNNIKNPYSYIIEADIMLGTNSDTMIFKNIFSYRHEIRYGVSDNGKYKPKFISPFGRKAVQENNTAGFVDDYRNRFAFNGTSYESWNFASSGIKDLKVENGKLTFTLTEDKGYIVSNLPLNLFAYSKCAVNLNGTTASKVAFGYQGITAGGFTLGNWTDVKDVTYLDIADGNDSSAKAAMLYFEGKAGDKVIIDSIEYTTDFNFDGRLINDGKVIRMTVSGKAFPIFEKDVTKENFEISGLPAGVTVEKIEQYNANTVYVYLSDAISQGTEISVSANAQSFIPYFENMLSGVDFGHRTPEEEAELFGYSAAQDYITVGNATGSFTVK